MAANMSIIWWSRKRPKCLSIEAHVGKVQPMSQGDYQGPRGKITAHEPKWSRICALWAAPESRVVVPWLSHGIASALFFLALLETTAPASPRPRSPPTPAPKGFALHRRGASQRTGMAAARHLRSGLPLIRAHLAASESAAVAQVPAPNPLSVVETDPFLSISIGLPRPVSDLGLPCLVMF